MNFKRLALVAVSLSALLALGITTKAVVIANAHTWEGLAIFQRAVTFESTTATTGAVTNSSTVLNSGAVTNSSTVLNSGAVTSSRPACAAQQRPNSSPPHSHLVSR